MVAWTRMAERRSQIMACIGITNKQPTNIKRHPTRIKGTKGLFEGSILSNDTRDVQKIIKKVTKNLFAENYSSFSKILQINA